MTLARIEHEANPIAVTDQLKGMVDLYTLYLKACEELLQDGGASGAAVN